VARGGPLRESFRRLFLLAKNRDAKISYGVSGRMRDGLGRLYGVESYLSGRRVLNYNY